MSNELWDYGGVGDEDHELEADEGGDGSDGEACGDAGGDDAASEQAGEDAPLGCAYGCAQAGHAGGDLELMTSEEVQLEGVEATEATTFLAQSSQASKPAHAPRLAQITAEACRLRHPSAPDDHTTADAERPTADTNQVR
eukprot:jgi/Tetstr1/455223/TSEL_042071.t1